MNQSEMFEQEGIVPDYSLTEPLIWIERISFWSALGAEMPIREIPFRKGLNIIATEIAGKDDKEPVGHDVGKTMLMRILRYCLGEERYVDKDAHQNVVGVLPNAYALAHFHVDGSSWCIARPLGMASTRTGSWCRRANDLNTVRNPEGAEPYTVFTDELNRVTKNCYADKAGVDLFAHPPKPWRRRVYQLYNLTESEIAIVEGGA